MKYDGFAQKVRTAGMAIQKEAPQVTVDALEAACRIQTRADRKKLYDTLRDFRRRGEAERIGQGVYIFHEKTDRPLQKREIMWRFLRMQKNLTLDDLRVACGVSLEYADEYMQLLVKLGIVRRHENGRCQLIKDQLEMPVNEAKAQKLRDVRARKKARLALNLKKATIAISEAIRFLEDEELE